MGKWRARLKMPVYAVDFYPYSKVKSELIFICSKTILYIYLCQVCTILYSTYHLYTIVDYQYIKFYYYGEKNKKRSCLFC